jgi:hypothetical protein
MPRSAKVAAYQQRLFQDEAHIPAATAPIDPSGPPRAMKSPDKEGLYK